MSKRGRLNEGRPTKYAPWMLPVVRVCGRLGATLKDLAEALQIDDDTVSQWMREDDEFSGTARAARELADSRVERSLFERATGFQHTSEKVFCNAKGEVTRAETQVKYPPDTAAAMFWLRNRQPEKWREKPDPSGAAPTGQNLDANQVVDGLVALAQKHPIAALPLRQLLQSALDRIPNPEA